ncbi:hypothetical protein PO883_24900, partial [Massilia sp. DJPM01]
MSENLLRKSSLRSDTRQANLFDLGRAQVVQQSVREFDANGPEPGGEAEDWLTQPGTCPMAHRASLSDYLHHGGQASSGKPRNRPGTCHLVSITFDRNLNKFWTCPATKCCRDYVRLLALFWYVFSVSGARASPNASIYTVPINDFAQNSGVTQQGAGKHTSAGDSKVRSDCGATLGGREQADFARASNIIAACQFGLDVHFTWGDFSQAGTNLRLNNVVLIRWQCNSSQDT